MVDLFLICLAIVALCILISDLRNKGHVPESLTIFAMTIAAFLVHHYYLSEVI